MPVEFALRPRIRLREDPAPTRRVRPRLPKFALPALAYWLVIGSLVYGFVRHHDATAPIPDAEAAPAPLTPTPAPTLREWWRPLPARTTPPAPPPSVEASAAEPPVAKVEPPPREPAIAEAPPEHEREHERRDDHEHAQAMRLAPVLPPASPFKRDDVSLTPPAALAPTSTPSSPPSSHSAFASNPVHETSSAASSGALPSCEAALASGSQDIDFSGGNRAADLPTQAIAAVLENGAWLSSCSVPERTAIDVCVAIKGGRVVGASVTTRPADSALSSCVRRRAASLQFPYNPHLDLARTQF